MFDFSVESGFLALFAASFIAATILPGGSEPARVWRIDLHAAEPRRAEAPPLLDCLRELGIELQQILCGGSDPVTQQREQWTDGANAFSVAPGVIVCYDRNERTADELDRPSQAVKALFATGFFRDVRLEVQDGVLVVIVQERPTISRIDVAGNKEFETDVLKKALKEIGLAEARIFDRSALDRAEQEIKRQYISRGRYAAKVIVTVTPQERNRVAVNINIEEGEPSKIARISIVGNKAFPERELLSLMTLTTPRWTTWYTKNDQYSKQKLQEDLEALRSHYQNRGYLEFNVQPTTKKNVT